MKRALIALFMIGLVAPTFSELPAVAAARPHSPTTALATTVVTDTEALVVYRVVERRCPDVPALGSPTIVIAPPQYQFSCAVSAGHAITGAIERFADESVAQAAFEAARGSHPLETFHGYPAYSWQANLTPPLIERGLSYLAGRRLVRATAMDDTAFGVPLPAEDIYQAAAYYCLFPGQRCTIYLPAISVKREP